MVITTIISTLLAIALGWVALKTKKQLNKVETKLQEQAELFEKERAEIRRDAKKRSGAVQWGKTIEHFVPFMSDFPVPPEDVTFLGMPIDYVGFSNTGSKTKCSVHFVEVKSGSSFLLGKQKNIKKAIEEGRVHWHEISVDGNNVK
jgi:predicted Holliday junction resolvase-like endonuclease